MNWKLKLCQWFGWHSWKLERVKISRVSETPVEYDDYGPGSFVIKEKTCEMKPCEAWYICRDCQKQRTIVLNTPLNPGDTWPSRSDQGLD